MRRVITVTLALVFDPDRGGGEPAGPAARRRGDDSRPSGEPGPEPGAGPSGGGRSPRSRRGAGHQMDIAVVDAGGNLKAFARMDGAWLGSIDIATTKARTARYFDLPTEELGELSQPGGPLYGIEVSNGGLITFPGGLPLKADDGTVIGAIGVSGSTVENDRAVAVAGAAALGGPNADVLSTCRPSSTRSRAGAACRRCRRTTSSQAAIPLGTRLIATPGGIRSGTCAESVAAQAATRRRIKSSTPPTTPIPRPSPHQRPSRCGSPRRSCSCRSLTVRARAVIMATLASSERSGRP